ncbi:MAG TPA: SCP2 sterol-binding domain-containing protein [Lysobacter sp.]|nr:SCP2 sterol-binding domain-containing protein [Lysobacter sp.]
MEGEPAGLSRVRHAIDCMDGLILLSLAGRARLARSAGRCKRAAGLPLRDRAREARVLVRAEALAHLLGLPASTARRAIALAIDDACRVQDLAPDLSQGAQDGARRMIAIDMHSSPEHPQAHARAARLLRFLPPPARLAPLLRALPPVLQRRVLRRVIATVLAAPIDAGALEFMRGRRLGIEVTDLALHWVIEFNDAGISVSDSEPEASVRGSATDLLLLASRLEDADTLFFQRRLMLTGDTELGLTVRNLLERLPWETVPLGLRIGLNRGARLARAARAAHRGEA